MIKIKLYSEEKGYRFYICYESHEEGPGYERVKTQVNYE